MGGGRKDDSARGAAAEHEGDGRFCRVTKFYGIFCANCPKKFKNVLDREERVLYYIKAREGSGNNATVRVNAMMQEIASQDGNFCGVCPVIGRLRITIRRISPQ